MKNPNHWDPEAMPDSNTKGKQNPIRIEIEEFADYNIKWWLENIKILSNTPI